MRFRLRRNALIFMTGALFVVASASFLFYEIHQLRPVAASGALDAHRDVENRMKGVFVGVQVKSSPVPDRKRAPVTVLDVDGGVKADMATLTEGMVSSLQRLEHVDEDDVVANRQDLTAPTTKYIVSNVGESCDAACGAVQLHCAQFMFFALNRCSTLRAIFTESTKCQAGVDPSFPGANTDGVVWQNDEITHPEAHTLCAAANSDVTRICACQTRAADAGNVVSDMVRKRAPEMPLRHGVDKEMVLDHDINYIVGKMGKSCSEACHDHGWVCADFLLGIMNDFQTMVSVSKHGGLLQSVDPLIAYAPAYIGGEHARIVTNNGLASTCGASHQLARRGCACALKHRRHGVTVVSPMVKKAIEKSPAVPVDMKEQIRDRHVEIIVSEVGGDCGSACNVLDLHCAPRLFSVFSDSCEIAGAAFPDMKSCAAGFWGHDLPSYRTDEKIVLANNKISAVTCDAKPEVTHPTRRLCICERPKLVVDYSHDAKTKVIRNTDSKISRDDRNALMASIDALKIVLGAPTKSCTDVCSAAGSACAINLLPAINSCEFLKGVFPNTGECHDRYYGSDLPAINSDNIILVNRQQPNEAFDTICTSSGAAQRVCTCLPSDGHDAVAPPGVLKRIIWKVNKRIEDEKRPEFRLANPMRPWAGGEKPWDTPATDFKKLLDTNAVSPAITFTGESCYNACKRQRKLCERDWFDVLNDCESLQAAFPTVKECLQGANRGHPSRRGAKAFVNSKPYQLASSCGTEFPDNQRVCVCGDPGPKGMDRGDFHNIYNVEANRYFSWISRYTEYWWRGIGARGKRTRLLSSTRMDNLEWIPTHVAGVYNRSDDVRYTPYNKPLAIDHWLRTAKVDEEMILITDPDCAFWTPLEFVVREGRPVAGNAWFTFEESNSTSYTDIAELYCADCRFVDPIAVPIMIHKNDLAKIAPLWLEITEQIRQDMLQQRIPSWVNHEWNEYLWWTAEMFGYIFAAAKLNIRHDMWALQVIPNGGFDVTPTTPIMHFHTEVHVTGYHGNGGTKWFKGFEDAATLFPWPVHDGEIKLFREGGMLKRRFFDMMHNASLYAPKDTFDYTGIGYRENIDKYLGDRWDKVKAKK